MLKKLLPLFALSVLISPCVFPHYLTEEEILEKIETLPEIEMQGEIICSTKRKKRELYRILGEIREEKRKREEEKNRTPCKHCGKKP